MTRRESVLVLSAIVLGVMVVAWSAVRFAEARGAALSAASDLAECRQLAARIESQRGAGQTVVTAAPRESELIRRIESAARTAELPQASIDRIEPGPSRRINDGPVSEKSTIVQLKNVTLHQLFAFLHAMSTSQSNLNLKQARLSVASPDDAGDRWSVESTLTYRVRAPE